MVAVLSFDENRLKDIGGGCGGGGVGDGRVAGGGGGE